MNRILSVQWLSKYIKSIHHTIKKSLFKYVIVAIASFGRNIKIGQTGRQVSDTHIHTKTPTWNENMENVTHRRQYVPQPIGRSSFSPNFKHLRLPLVVCHLFHHTLCSTYVTYIAFKCKVAIRSMIKFKQACRNDNRTIHVSRRNPSSAEHLCLHYSYWKPMHDTAFVVCWFSAKKSDFLF